MSDKQGWSEQDVLTLVNMASCGEFLNKDIAAYFKKKPASVTFKLKQLGIKNSAYSKVIGKWNCKHAHLREAVMTYFLTHSAEQTAKKFKLTASEFKSLMTVSYRLPEFQHLRKDKRRHDAWTAYEFRFMLQHLGLMPRDWIAKKLKRGGVEAIRGKLDVLGLSSKNTNGLNLSQFREAFGQEPKFYLQTKAGPGQGKHSSTFFKIIPWVWLDSEIKAGRLYTHDMFKQLISSMALFQEWAFGGDALKKMKRICK